MIEVRSLGDAEIQVGDVLVTPTSPRKFAILLYLAAERGRRIARMQLQELAFDDLPEAGAGHSLRETIYQLRQAGVPIDGDKNGLIIPSHKVRWDIDSVLNGAELTRDQLLAIERGFLPNAHRSRSAAFLEWLDRHRAAVALNLTGALLREISRRKSCSDWQLTIAAARACLSLDPFNEEATLALAEALALTGSKTRAVALLDEYLAEVGKTSAELKLPAAVLRRRISERVDDSYRASLITPLFGRLDELTSLRRGLESAVAGEPACAVVTGEPGIGKTRLAEEFAEFAQLRGTTVCRIAMHAPDKLRPLSAFIDLVPKFLEMPGALGCASESLAALERLRRAKAGDISELSMSALDIRFAELVRATADLVDALAMERPLLVVIDDAQFLDEPSVQTLTRILSPSTSLRFMVVFTTRAPRDLLGALSHVRSLNVVKLEPLPSDTASSLVRYAFDQLQRDASPNLAVRIAEAASGNPLFALTLAAQCSTSGDHFSIPHSLGDLIGRRIESVSPGGLAVLATAVTLGQHATATRLSACLDVSQFELLQSVSELVDSGLVRAGADGVHATHPLVAEVLGSRLPTITRQLANAKVAAVMQREADATASPALLWHAAECWIAAGDETNGFRSLRACADYALTIGRVGEAAHTLSRACSLKIEDRALLDGLTALVRVAHLAGESQIVFDTASRLKKLGRAPTHDDIELAEISAMMLAYVDSEGPVDKLLACVDACDSGAHHRLSAASWLLKYADLVGRPELLVAAQRACESLVASPEDSILHLEFRMVLASATDRCDESIQLAEDLIEATSAMAAAEQFRFRRNAAVALLRAGATARSLHILSEVYAAAQAMDCLQNRAMIAVHLASVYEDMSMDGVADGWHATGLEALREARVRQRPLHFFVYEIDRAIARERYLEAARLYDEAAFSGMFDRGPLTRRWRLVIESRLHTAESEPSKVDVRRALMIARSGVRSMSGIRDAEVCCGIAALVKVAHVARARTLLRNYLEKERRDRRILTRSLEAWRRSLFTDQPLGGDHTRWAPDSALLDVDVPTGSADSPAFFGEISADGAF